jgi:hypothetical protein
MPIEVLALLLDCALEATADEDEAGRFSLAGTDTFFVAVAVAAVVAAEKVFLASLTSTGLTRITLLYFFTFAVRPAATAAAAVVVVAVEARMPLCRVNFYTIMP